MCVCAYLVGLHTKNNQPHTATAIQCWTFISFNQATVTLGVFRISSSLSNCCYFGRCRILVCVTSIYGVPLSFMNAFVPRMSTSAYLCYGVNFVCWCPPCFYLSSLFFPLVKYFTYAWNLGIFYCMLDIRRRAIYFRRISWFQPPVKWIPNSSVEWEKRRRKKEAQTEWNEAWALSSSIRRETIDFPIYFCTVSMSVCVWVGSVFALSQ